MLYKREEYLRTINNALCYIELVCKNETLLHLTNSNTASEHFFCQFLNIVYDLSLINLNTLSPNYPAIDLGDSKNRLAFQVSVNGKARKIQDTLTKSDPHYTTKIGLKPNIAATKYPHLKFMIIGKKQGKYTTLKIPQGVQFNPENDIIDVSTLLKDLQASPTNILNQLAALISKEVSVGAGIIAAIPHSDQNALKVYRRHFDRPFMQDDWRYERSFLDFQHQCEEAISLLNSGVLDNQSITKSRHDFDDATDAEVLNNIYHEFRNILAEFRKRTRSTGTASPEIDIDRNIINFSVEATFDLFNALRQGITDQLNKLFQKHNISPILGVLR